MGAIEPRSIAPHRWERAAAQTTACTSQEGPEMRRWFIVDSGWKLVPLAVLGLACIWPALYNGQPLFFPDTSAYIRGADAGVARITGHASVWSLPPASAAGERMGPGHTDNLSEKFVISGRSVYYGVLLYLGDLLDHLWPTIGIQAGVIVLALALTLANTAGFSWFALAAGVAGLAVATPMAFYASFLMPDVFAGLTILAAANLLGYGDRMRLPALFFWFVLLCAANLFHTSHLLLTSTILAAAALWATLGRVPMPRAGVVCLAASIAVGFAGEAAFTLSVTKMLGAAPVRPPFVMNRLIADGPGAAFLRANCPQAGFTMCRFLDRLPPPGQNSAESDTQRQDTDMSTQELYNALAPETRRSLGSEQYAFALATLAYDPVAVLTSAAKDTIVQLRSFQLTEFDYGSARGFFADHIPQPYLAAMERTKAWAGKMPLRVLWGIILVVVILSALSIAGFLVQTWRMTGSGAFVRFVGIILLGVASNAVICGVLSGPYDRYQARVIWLVPLTAALALYRRRQTGYGRGQRAP
jgi:hypothetical protein